jgi:hypothetical protein
VLYFQAMVAKASASGDNVALILIGVPLLYVLSMGRRGGDGSPLTSRTLEAGIDR